MAPLWILIFVIQLMKWATCDYHCTMQIAEVTCFGIDADQLSEEISVTLNTTNTFLDKTDIATLNITNGIVSTISSGTFKDFTKLETLYVTDSKVSKLEDNAFSHLLDLTHLYLNNNTLTEFNIRSFTLENGLTVLDLSSNRLNDISDFNVSYFPKLSFLNLANNFLSYLPVNLLTKLQEHNQFYLVADNNPWDCNDFNWSENLTDNFINAFCPYQNIDRSIRVEDDTFEATENQPTNRQASDVSVITTKSEGDSNDQTVDRSPRVEDESTSEATKTTNHSTAAITTEIDKGNSNDWPLIQNVRDGGDDGNIGESTSEGSRMRDIQDCEKPNCAKCSLHYCIYWMIGGIWLGVIIGNIPKLMSLLCSKSSVYSDHSTQCEQSFADQYMVSGYHLDFNRKSSAGGSKINRPRTAHL